MKNFLVLIPITIALMFCSSCSKDDTIISSEITTLDSIDHTIFTELLRLNILEEYGGIFKQMKMYHAEVFDVGVPCDFDILNERVYRDLIDENLPNYSFSIPLEIAVNCNEPSGDIFGNENVNNRWYNGFQESGTQTATSDLMSVEIRLDDRQTIAGNFQNGKYTYGQHGNRSIIITSGIAPEIDPNAELYLFFPSCFYDQENIEMTDITEARFSGGIRTNELEKYDYKPRKDFEGTIKLVDGAWTVFYEDGVVEVL